MKDYSLYSYAAGFFLYSGNVLHWKRKNRETTNLSGRWPKINDYFEFALFDLLNFTDSYSPCKQGRKQVFHAGMDKQNTPLRMEYHLEALTHEFSLRKAEPPLFVHELDGNPGSIVGMVKLTFEGPAPSAYNLACKRMAISCRTWEMYLKSQSVLNSL